ELVHASIRQYRDVAPHRQIAGDEHHYQGHCGQPAQTFRVHQMILLKGDSTQPDENRLSLYLRRRPVLGNLSRPSLYRSNTSPVAMMAKMMPAPQMSGCTCPWRSSCTEAPEDVNGVSEGLPRRRVCA